MPIISVEIMKKQMKEKRKKKQKTNKDRKEQGGTEAIVKG